MKEIRFVQIYKDNADLYQELLPNWLRYMEELNGNGEKRQGLTLRRDFIQYRQLYLDDLAPDMLKHFNRYQKVEKSWYNQNGIWVLVEEPYVANWDEVKKLKITTEDFPCFVTSGGALFGAFDGDKLIGFSGINGNFIGSKAQYVQLGLLHVSYEYRGKGIGRKLFSMVVSSAMDLGAKKLYISANNAQESQAFYRTVGCVNAEEIVPALFEAEPTDVHMEYLL